VEPKVKIEVSDPVLWIEKFLHVRLWGLQQEIARSVAANSRTVVKSCQASGKSFTAAQIALWFLAEYEESIIITTAPTAFQECVMWGEIHAALARSRYPFPKAGLTEVKFGPNHYAIGFKGVRFADLHAKNMLVILDEAPGIASKMWAAIEGACSADNIKILALGTPTISSQPYEDAFQGIRSEWSKFTISAFDTPNLSGLTLETLLALPDAELDYHVSPHLISRRWVRDMYNDYGTSNPFWKARVLGQFPVAQQ